MFKMLDVQNDRRKIFLMFGIKPRAFSILGKHSTTEIHLSRCFGFETGSSYVAQAGIEINIILHAVITGMQHGWFFLKSNLK
jgi:hypothetical protein